MGLRGLRFWTRGTTTRRSLRVQAERETLANRAIFFQVNRFDRDVYVDVYRNHDEVRWLDVGIKVDELFQYRQ